MNCICFRQSIKSNESDRLHCIAIGLPINYRTTFSKGRFSPSRRYATGNCCWSTIYLYYISCLCLRNSSIIWGAFTRSYRFDHKLIKAIHCDTSLSNSSNRFSLINSHWFINGVKCRSIVIIYIIYEKTTLISMIFFFDRYCQLFKLLKNYHNKSIDKNIFNMYRFCIKKNLKLLIME